jgi:BirA family biotin operon repressor/biotin-[acetyl-CoA-carboxylase] ligase
MVSAAHLQSALASAWSRVEVVAETGSTNADLLADTAAPDRSVLVAERQTAGRGRLDRTWTAPAGASLTFSVLIRPEPAMAAWGWLPLLTGLALQEAVVDTTGVAAGLKWPNDLLVGPERLKAATPIAPPAATPPLPGGPPLAPPSSPRAPGPTLCAIAGKAAGILAQTNGPAVVIGIGLNVSTAADDLPVPTATSLALCGARELDHTVLLTAILSRLDARLTEWTGTGGDAQACGLAAAYEDACLTLGQPVSVSTTAGETLTGTATGIDGTGRILVRTGAGTVAVGAGDVQHLRPAPPPSAT